MKKIAEKDFISIQGICNQCRSDVANYTCNAPLLSARPEGIDFDYWASCTNPNCKHHYGEGYFQDTPDWAISKPSKKAIHRTVNRIRYELNAIYEEGFDSPDFWYALDRIIAIRGVCDELYGGNELACIGGFGKESEEDAKKLDLPSDVPNFSPETYQSPVKE